jgi:putative hemolysin
MGALSETPLFPQFIGFLIALLCTALFSFLETTVTALRLYKLKELEQNNGRYQKILQILEKNPHQILITILIASSLSNTTAAALITNIMETLFASIHLSSGLGFSLGIGIATSSILLFGEIIPKNFARAHGERIIEYLLWFINGLYIFFLPFITLLVKFSNFIIYLISGKKAEESFEAITSEKEIQFMIDYIDEKGIMENEKTAMLKSIFSLSQTPVKEIMVPAINVVSINVDASLEDALDMFRLKRFSRLPVYERTQDNIIGMIYQKDVFHLLSKAEAKQIRELVRPILLVPESIKVNQLLREFKQQRLHLAMVINEFGGIAGLVSLEDVLEEIVGEIADEHEAIPEMIIPLKQGGWLVDAAVDLEELTDLLGVPFEAENAITLGGFLTEQLQHLPRKGERISYRNYCFQIQHASPKRVHEVLVFQEQKMPEVTLD